MSGIFCTGNIKDERELINQLKKNIMIYGALILLGVVIVVAAFLLRNQWNSSLEEHIEFYYYGGGTGLIFSGLLALIRGISVLKDPEKKQQMLLEVTDERNERISNKAMKCALLAAFLFILVFIFIGGIYQPEIVKPMAYIVVVFTAVYNIAAGRLRRRY